MFVRLGTLGSGDEVLVEHIVAGEVRGTGQRTERMCWVITAHELCLGQEIQHVLRIDVP